MHLSSPAFSSKCKAKTQPATLRPVRLQVVGAARKKLRVAPRAPGGGVPARPAPFPSVPSYTAPPPAPPTPTPTYTPPPPTQAPAPVQAAQALQASGPTALIVNTKGGGHAPFGLYLAKALIQKGFQVTILNDGDASLAQKDPFSMYASFGKSCEVIWGSPKDTNNLPMVRFDVVYDNNGKDLETCKPLIDFYGSKVKQFCFVSSAGMCKDNAVEPMVFEDSPCKEKGHYFVEEYLKQQNVPFTIFRPLYPYGKFTMKDCEQYFMDRIVRDRPILIPGQGDQLVSLSHYEDCGNLMAAVVGNPKAMQNVYNLTSDAAISFNGVALACAKAAGKEAKIIHYDGEAHGKGSWPFRLGHFFASATKAQVDLDWAPQHNFEEDMQECMQRYMASGRAQKDIDFSKDDALLAALGQSVAAPQPVAASSSFW